MNCPFLKTAIAATALACSPPALALEVRYFGPINGPNSIIGQQIESGATSQIEDDGCSADKALESTLDALASGIQLFIGFPCVEALDAAADTVSRSDGDHVILALGIEAKDITSRDRRPDWPVFRLGPSSVQETDAIASYIKKEWRNRQFAIIDDGTLYGRQLAESVRFALENDNLKPVFTDTYRPLLERQSGLVRRIGKAGATHVFIGGDAYDAAIIGKDAEDLGVPLVLAGGSAFQAPPDDGALPDGTVYAARSTTGALLGLDGPASAPGYYEVLSAVARQISTQLEAAVEDGGTGLKSIMRQTDFQTDIGAVSFDAVGENNIDWFSIYQIKDEKAVAVPKTGVDG